MNPYEELTHYAGFDWASDHHDVIILDDAGKLVADFKFDHSVAGWQLWKERIALYPKLGVAIETSFGAVVEQILGTCAHVYPVHPASAKRYRERKHPSGTKTDRHDAWALADALRTDGHAWRQLSEKDPMIEELRILCRDEVSLIGERTALINQARQAAREYYPTALEAFEDWTTPSTWAFIERFPDSAALKKAGRRQWEKFLHTHKLYRPETTEKRLALFAAAADWQINDYMIQAKRIYLLTKIKQLRALEAQLKAYRQRIEDLFTKHPDSEIFGSLPGAGAKLAPRLLAEIGSDRNLHQDAQSLQCLSGTAPVSYQSGKISKVNMRRACNHNLRHTMHLLADLSRLKSPWARVYYDQLRERGKTHAQALRSLGQRWLSILFRMWQTRTCYEADKHTQNQIKHGSWVLKIEPTK